MKDMAQPGPVQDRQEDASAAAPVPGPGNSPRESSGLVSRAAAALAGLVRRREAPPVGKGGAYGIGSESFRSACAILPDGAVRIVKAYNTGEIAAEEAELRARFDLPAETSRTPASLAEVAALHGRKAQALVSQTPTTGQMRMRRALAEAAALGASDIKLIERPTHGIMRVKVGAGEFTHGAEWQADEVEEAVNWIYSSRDGGDGRASKIKGVAAAFSIGQSDMPPGAPSGIAAFRGQLAWHGDLHHFLNLRLLPEADAASYADLAGLGLERDVLDALEEERRSEAGLVIIGGSTGDGKSTTLVRNLERLYEDRDGQVSIYTIEDPVEIPFARDGVVQFPVRGGITPEERRANYSVMLMTFVRTNPDVGMVSEIRSVDDVNEVLHFVSSGHKVLTTVHVDSANGVLFRLISLGVRPEELAVPGLVNLVMRQKLVPKLCSRCAEPLAGPARARVEAWLGEDTLFRATAPSGPVTPLRRNRAGCDRCLGRFSHLSGAPAETARAAWAGYEGRRATAEFIRVDDAYRRFVADRDALGARNHWLAPQADGGMGGIPMETRLRRLVAGGVTDFEHVTNETLPDPLPAIAGPNAATEDANG